MWVVWMGVFGWPWWVACLSGSLLLNYLIWAVLELIILLSVFLCIWGYSYESSYPDISLNLKKSKPGMLA